MQLKRILKKKEFRSWLESKVPKTKVAPKKYNESSCPIARCIKEKNNVSHVDVYPHLIKIMENDNSTSMYTPSPWAEKFINTIDMYSLKKDGSYNRSVSAKKALEILDDIK